MGFNMSAVIDLIHDKSEYEWIVKEFGRMVQEGYDANDIVDELYPHVEKVLKDEF